MEKNARFHCDRHVVKMITEHNQLLCSAYYFTGNIPDGIYKLTHENHPCAKWTRESLSNWLWLRDMNLVLCSEYTFRYGKIHKGELLCKALKPPEIEDRGLTAFAQALPDAYKSEDAAAAYRKYYVAEKKHLFFWKKREAPEWIYGEENNNCE